MLAPTYCKHIHGLCTLHESLLFKCVACSVLQLVTSRILSPGLSCDS